MLTPMRRKDRQISVEQTERLLQEGEYGVLSTVDIDGQPYSIPLNYIYSDNCIFFHCAREGHKLDNIKYNPSVSFCIVGKTEVLPEKFTTNYESAIVFGTASEVSGKEKESALLDLVTKYSPDYIKEGTDYVARAAEKTCVIKVEINRLTGKARK